MKNKIADCNVISIHKQNTIYYHQNTVKNQGINFSHVQSNTIIQRLTLLWSEVLNMLPFNDHENFFLCGGQSLKASILTGKIYNEFIINLSVSDIYENPTIKELAHKIASSPKEEKKEQIRKEPLQKHYIASSAQKRMYILSNTEHVDISYNVSVVLEFTTKINTEKVRDGLQYLSDRHQGLRTSFKMLNGQLVQQIAPEVTIPLTVKNITKNELAHEVKTFVQPFNMTDTSLVRVSLFNIQEENSVLVLDSHHIIMDGTSVGILTRELLNYLKGITDENPLYIQYRDYSAWQQQKWYGTLKNTETENYWLKKFKDAPLQLKMPRDKVKPDEGLFIGKRIEIKIEKELFHKIQKYILDQGVSLFHFLLSNYGLLLSKHNLSEDIVVGTAVANRPFDTLQKVIGMFVNMLPLRLYPTSDKTYHSFLQEVKDSTLEASKYQDYPFDLLIEKLQLSGTNSKTPLINTLFTVQNLDFFESTVHNDIVNLKYENATETSKFEFSMFVLEKPNYLTIEMEYDTLLYEEATMFALLDKYVLLIKKSLENPSQKLIDFSFAKPLEKKQQDALKNENSMLNKIDFNF